MRAYLLCPGASVGGAPARRGDGLTIGVNRVPLQYTCDVWACGDLPCAARNHAGVIGAPTWFTLAGTADALRPPWRGPITRFEDIEHWCPDWAVWRGALETTALWALLYAGWAGATDIIAYGVDWQGTADWDGTTDGGNRTAMRWQKEREVWENLIAPWMRRRNITVTRAGI